jgi:soluble lytic murein transglycosylase-like protein
MKKCPSLLIILLLFQPAMPAWAQDDLRDLFDAPCARYGVPKALALAIARHESGLHPWFMNIEGKTVRAFRQDEAMTMARQALSLGLSFDIGVMQVNSQWLRRYNLPLEVVFDPRGNIQVGVWILAQSIRKYGLTWEAVASYHTSVERNPNQARAYAATIFAQLYGQPRPAQARKATANGFSSARQSSILVKRYREIASTENNKTE